MPDTLTNLISAIQQNPQRSDLVAGFMGLCVTLQNPIQQAFHLTECSKSILSTQPLLALKLLELALLVSPRNEDALQFALEIFRKRGKWSAEQRVIEYMSTHTQVAATTVVPTEIASNVAITTTKSELAEFLNSEPDEQKQNTPKETPDTQDISPPSADARIFEFLNRCGFDPSLASYAVGVSQTNAGLVAFVSMLISLGLIRADELMLAGIMLQKMITERPDESGASTLFERLFPDLSLNSRGGKP